MDTHKKFPFKCPKCGLSGTASCEYLGKTVTCPKCKATISVSVDGSQFSLGDDLSQVPSNNIQQESTQENGDDQESAEERIYARRESFRMMRDLNDICQEFRSGKYDLEIVWTLISYLERDFGYAHCSNHEQFDALLQIPIDVMQHDVEVRDMRRFQDEGTYFSSNVTPEKTEFLSQLKAKLKSCNFKLKDIVDLTEEVRDHYLEVDKVTFLLRIPEVVIRDHVQLKVDSKFLSSGKIFAMHIEKVMGLSGP